MRYYILVRKKGSSRYTGAIPTKKGVTVSKIKNMIRRNMNKKYAYKIVSEKQLKTMLTRLKKKHRR